MQTFLIVQSKPNICIEQMTLGAFDPKHANAKISDAFIKNYSFSQFYTQCTKM